MERQSNMPLWPERFDVDALAKIRESVGPQWWSSLYQQTPVALGGGIIQSAWWQYYDKPPRVINRTVIALDTAFKTKTTSDYSVAAVWALVENGLYVLDVLRDRVEFPGLLRMVYQLHGKYPDALWLIEDAASGQSLIQVLNRESAIPVHAVEVVADKVTRLSKVSGYIESGRCFLPSDASWVYDFVQEHSQFPQGAHDDQCDSTAMAIGYLSRHLPGSRNTIFAESKKSRWKE